MSGSMLEGQTIGKYRVLEALGRGGMAQVYRAYHAQLNRYAAIKVLRPDLMEDAEFLARFQREARAIAKLRHQNIVQVFDFDTQDRICYMVMELLEGDTLRAQLNKYRTEGKRMPLPDVIHILKDALNGLGYAHGQGIIHRDIKPANIMLTSQGDAVITDFGIAQIIGSTQFTLPGSFMGTLSYMAPEQGLKGHCDERSDIYSLGIVFYEMLTGFTPFDADTPLAILMKHLNDPLPLPRQIDPTMPLALENIVLKALSKEPDERFQNCQEMSAVLKQINAEELPADAREMPINGRRFDSHAVFSGTSRQNIPDQRFANEDTDPYLASTAAARAGVALPFKPGSLAAKSLESLEKMNLHPMGAVLGGLGVIILVNFCAAMISTLTQVNVFVYGWPFEIFLAAGFLAALMWALKNHWLIIPTSILFGNAAILAYCAITRRWGDWVFLWMLEPLIVGAAIFIPIRINQKTIQPKLVGGVSGILFSILSVLLASMTCLLAVAASILRILP